MTDKTERPADPSDPVKTSEWRREAEALRKTVSFEMASLRGSAYSGWQKIMGWLLLVISIGGTVDLIAVPRHRHFLIQGSRMVWGQWWSIEDSQMFKLPPPPPRSVESRVIEPSSPVATIPADDATMIGHRGAVYPRRGAARRRLGGRFPTKGGVT